MRERTKTALKREASAQDRERLVATVATTVGAPIAFALLGGFSSQLWEFSHFLAIIVWLIVLFLFGFFVVRLSPTNRSLISLAVENDELKSELGDASNDLDQLRQSINIFSIQSEFVLSTRRMVLGTEFTGAASPQDIREAVSKIMAPLHQQGGALFGFTGDELWNFAVYFYDDVADELFPVWREKAATHPSQGDGRVWQRGVGHVGIAFANGESIITRDGTHPDAGPLSEAPIGKKQGYDSEAYRSFASIPLGPMRETDSEPYGVLVATSDVIGRFDRENTAILVHAAEVVANFMLSAAVKPESIRVRPTGGESRESTKEAGQ